MDDINTGNEEGNDDGLQDFLLQLNQDRERKKDRQELEENDSMIFVSMSTSVGVQILAKIDEKVEDRTYTVNETQANPEFLAPGFSQWLMIMSLDRAGPSYSYQPGYIGDNRLTDDSYSYSIDNIKNIDDDDGNGSDNGNRFKNSGRHSDSYSDNAPSTFNILKFVLFGLLIISPCLRAFHLWWAGGGRIRIRHSEDDDNRVVGLQYIPPMENWFGAYEPTEGERVHDRLTHEQVMSLPEIIYQKPCFDDDCDDENEENHTYNEIDDRSENTEEDDNVIDVSQNSDDDSTADSVPSNITRASMNSSDRQSKEGSPSTSIPSSFSEEVFSLPKLPSSPERVISTSSASTNTDTVSLPPSSSSSSVGSNEELPLDEEQPADAVLSFRTQRRLRAFTTTTCTTCSICIDEFEEGEKIRLLPLCGHGFHTECILPWLKDRQGCCPLCKIAVLGDSNENGIGGNGNTRVEI